MPKNHAETQRELDQLPDHEKLNAIRDEREGKLTVLSVIVSTPPAFPLVLVIARDDSKHANPEKPYHLMRYWHTPWPFPQTAKPEGHPHEEWAVSFDGAGVPLAAVFSWLNAPSARVTDPKKYIKQPGAT